MFKRIKYISQFARPLSAQEIARLAEAAARKNAVLGVTGVLMTSGGIFFQIIEGPPEAVDRLWETIARDRRHTDVLLLSVEGGVKRRLYPDWGMKTMDLDAASEARMEPLKAILHAILNQRRVIDTLSSSLERALWHELSGAGR